MESTNTRWWSQRLLLWRMFFRYARRGVSPSPIPMGPLAHHPEVLQERGLHCFSSAHLGMSLLAFLPSLPPFLLLLSFISRLMVYLPRGRATDSLLMLRLKPLLCRNGVWFAFLKGSFRLNNALGVNERVKPARERGGGCKSFFCESVFFLCNFV